MPGKAHLVQRLRPTAELSEKNFSNFSLDGLRTFRGVKLVNLLKTAWKPDEPQNNFDSWRA
jgi:hypothetical protein